MSVHPSTQFLQFQWNLACRYNDEWCTMVCSMTWSKVKVTSPWKLEILPLSKAISSAIYNRSWQLTTDFFRAEFLIFVLVFCFRWLWTWQKRQLWRVDRQSHTGLIYPFSNTPSADEHLTNRQIMFACVLFTFPWHDDSLIKFLLIFNMWWRNAPAAYDIVVGAL